MISLIVWGLGGPFKREIILEDRPIKITLLKELSNVIRSGFTSQYSIRTSNKASITSARNLYSTRYKAASHTNIYHYNRINPLYMQAIVLLCWIINVGKDSASATLQCVIFAYKC